MDSTTGQNLEQVLPSFRLMHVQLLSILSGVQRVSLDEFVTLPRDQFEPYLVCKSEGPLSRLASSFGAHCDFVPDLVRPISPASDIRALRGISAIIRRHRPDILHTHSSKTGLLGRLAGRWCGVPVIVHTVHGFAFPHTDSTLVRTFYRFLEIVGGFACDAVIVLNEDDRTIAIKQLRIPPNRVHLIGNGVDTAKFSPRSPDERMHLRQRVFGLASPTTVCIGMVGRLWRQKNPMCLVHAARLLRDRGLTDFKVLLIGDGELHSEILQNVNQMGLRDHVGLLGWRDDVPALLSGLDIFVLPSLWEGLPLAILEAMASGVPVVASAIPGNRELVEDSIDGHLFEANNAMVLAEKIQLLIDDPTRARQMGAAGREKIVSRYNLKVRTDRVRDLYLQLLNRSSINPT
jgi:glycosyltransferase involved in cell wall biosynthesis